MLERIGDRVMGLGWRLAVKLNSRIAGDDLSKPLTKEQLQQLNQWHQVELPALRKSGVDTRWGEHDH